MTIDCGKYLINKDFIVQSYKEDTFGRGISYLISSLACSTMVPCVVVAYWIGEASGWHQDAIDTINSLTKFYGYTNILNKPDGSPV